MPQQSRIMDDTRNGVKFVRVSGAEFSFWNADYEMRVYSSMYYTDPNRCPEFNRWHLKHINNLETDPGYKYYEFDIDPPQKTNGNGWCLWRQRRRPEPSYLVYCAPPCDASPCCMPRTGWRIMHGEAAGNMSNLEVVGFGEDQVPPAPPLVPLPPQPPQPPAIPPPFLSLYGPGIFIPSGLLTTLCLVVSVVSFIRWRRRVHQDRILKSIRREQAKVKQIELELRALPTRCMATEPAEGAECAVCLEPFVIGEEIRTLPCGHEVHA